MAILKFGKTICITSLLSLGLMSNAYAVDDEDVLGQFLEQKLMLRLLMLFTPTRFNIRRHRLVLCLKRNLR